MAHYPYTLSDGLEIRIALKRSAKKNLILRPINAHEISINIPPFLSESRLKKWLDENETLLRKTLARKPAAPDPHEKPDSIWYRGVQTALGEHGAQTIALMPSEILLPQKDWDAQKNHLRRFLTERAAEYLLPRLLRHADAMNLAPAAVGLSNAKTFWGVCRAKTGIRLNWRLIGAPEAVADYVCIHELCHLPHPDHSPRFWAMVHRHTPNTDEAKRWLKANGGALFVLG